MQAKNVCVRGQLVTQHFLFSFNISSFPVLVCDPVCDPIRDPICDPVRDLVHDLVHFDPGFVNTGLHIVKAHKWFWTGNDPRTANDPKIVL